MTGFSVLSLVITVVVVAGAGSAVAAQSVCSGTAAVSGSTTDVGLIADCDALLKAAEALDPNGTLNWAKTVAMASWEGVTLAGSPARVDTLQLHTRSLNGTIPAELGDLTNLTILGLTYNGLSGSIPAELGDLTNLTTLRLNSNGLSGSIPAEFGNLTNLTTLGLTFNVLSGSIPAELGNLTNLTTLDLSVNGLSGSIPAELGNLTNLTTLWLYGNGLSGSIPAELGNLTNLTTLLLSGNGLSGSIPAELGNLTNLTTLDLSGNGLSGSIPAELGNLTNLTNLWLYGNGLTGCIPPALSSFLSGLGLPECTVPACSGTTAVSGSTTDVGLIADCDALLKAAEASDPNGTLNWAKTVAMASWEGVTLAGSPARVETLQLHARSLNGTIPAELGNLTNLTTLDLSGNGLSGSIPAELGNLTNLTTLGLTGNSLTGCIPPALSSFLSGLGLPECTVPAQSVCSGTAAVPGSTTDVGLIADCDALLKAAEALDPNGTLNWAKTVAMASWEGVTLAGSPARVETLQLHARSLNGTIPAELGNLTNLTTLDLSRNGLSGSIPAELGNLTNLTNLGLTGNGLTGCIPPALSSFLSGLGLPECTVPACSGTTAVSGSTTDVGLIADCDALLKAAEALDPNGTLNWATTVAMASWEGVTLAGSPARVETLQLHARSLNGTIPAELGDLTNLKHLRLTGNSLTGCIPPALSSFLSGLGLPECTVPACSGTAAVSGSTTDVGLIADCDALLKAAEALDPNGTLNWAKTVAMASWEGVTLAGTASSIGRCTVPVMMTGANTSTNRWRYQHARRTAGVARTRGDLPRAGRGSAGGLGRHRPSGGSTSHDGGPGNQRRGRP